MNGNNPRKTIRKNINYLRVQKARILFVVLRYLLGLRIRLAVQQVRMTMQFTREELALIQTALHVQDGCLKSERGMGGDASGVISNTITKVASLRDRIQSYLLRDNNDGLRSLFPLSQWWPELLMGSRPI